MVFYMTFTDNRDPEHRRQEVESSVKGEDVFFCAEDLPEEEAKIGAYLFDGKDFIEALRLGMRIAQSGYTSIEVVEIPWEE